MSGNRKMPPIPEVSNFSRETGRPGRGEMNDQRLADALDIGVNTAHEMIEGVNEHRSTDMDGED
jgi:hypothetical protein